MADQQVCRPLPWLPTVHRACCCCSLEMFSLVIGYLSAVLSLLQLIALCVYTAGGGFHYISLVWIIAACIFFFQAVIGFVLSIIYVVGVHQKNHVQLMPFVIYLHVNLIFGIHGAIYVGVILPFTSLLFLLPSFGIFLYVLTCVNSLREKIGREHSAVDFSKGLPSAPPKETQTC